MQEFIVTCRRREFALQAARSIRLRRLSRRRIAGHEQPVQQERFREHQSLRANIVRRNASTSTERTFYLQLCVIE